MLKQKLHKGFTLIELLVVIAIIGILASVVLASLNSARDKGEDAAIKSNLNNARGQAALYYDDNGDYAGVCTAGAGTIFDMIPDGGTCRDDADHWIAYASLVSASSSAYCVDSEGNAVTTAADLSAETTCE